MIGRSRVQLALVLCAFLVILNTGEMRGAGHVPNDHDDRPPWWATE